MSYLIKEGLLKFDLYLPDGLYSEGPLTQVCLYLLFDCITDLWTFEVTLINIK